MPRLAQGRYSTSFAFELTTSVIFKLNSFNMLSKLLQTETANSFDQPPFKLQISKNRMKMRVTDVGRKYRQASQARCCKVTFRSHHTA